MEFRTRETTQNIEQPIEITPDDRNDGNQDKAITSEPNFASESELDKWEIQNGKYGLEYLGIKEIGKQFPYNAQFSQLDKYIKAEMDERKFDKTPTMWQNILKELEMEAGSEKLNAVERLKRLSGYVQVLNNLKKAQEKRKLYSQLYST